MGLAGASWDLTFGCPSGETLRNYEMRKLAKLSGKHPRALNFREQLDFMTKKLFRRK